MPYDFKPERLDFCNWGEIRSSYLFVCPKNIQKGGGRERDIEDDNKTPFVVLTH